VRRVILSLQRNRRLTFIQAIGVLASTVPNANDLISGLLVSKDYSYTLLDPRDLGDFAGLSTSVVTQRQLVNVEVNWELIKWHLESMFGTITEGLSDDKSLTLRVYFRI
jgi:cleavage and polyadenylation specificity factor subunit 3